MQISYIFLLVFAVVIAVFAAVNNAVVEVNFLFVKTNASLAVVILASAAIGAVIGYSVDIIKRIKSKLRIKDLEKQNKILNERIIEFENKETKVIENETKAEDTVQVDLSK